MKSVTLTQNDIGQVDSTRNTVLGQPGVTSDGRKFRYAGFNGTVTPGQLLATPAPVANHQNCAPAANFPIGTQDISVTLGATAATKDQYAGGTLFLNDGVGAGQDFRIIGNTAGASSGTIIVRIETGLNTAITSASSKISLVASKYSGLTASATVALTRVGVANAPATAGQFGWIQTGGDTAVLIDGSLVAIADPVIPGSVAGSVAGIGTVAATDQVVGIARAAAADTKYGIIDLSIDR